MMTDALVEQIVREVAELPDRTSPDDWPEAMLVTADEIGTIIRAALATAQVGAADWQAKCKEYADALFDLRNKCGCGPDQEGPDIWERATAAEKKAGTLSDFAPAALALAGAKGFAAGVEEAAKHFEQKARSLPQNASGRQGRYLAIADEIRALCPDTPAGAPRSGSPAPRR